MTTPDDNGPPTTAELLGLQRHVLEMLQALTDQVGSLRQEQAQQSQTMAGLAGKVDGLTNDIAMVKGGHAIAAMRRNAALIADDLGCQLIEELPQGVIVGFAKVAADNGEPAGEVDSFRHADMVMYGRVANGHPCYIAVEASFTVNANDVTGAARNAGYLQKYTGIQSHAVVAGVDVLPDAQALIHQGDAQLYRIRPGDLQPE